jgi:hypothetical protein
MTENLQDFLAINNDSVKERYIEKIRKNVEEEYPNKADEIALHRKEIDYLRYIITNILLPKLDVDISLEDDEYIKYTNDIEKIKEKSKADLGL